MAAAYYNEIDPYATQCADRQHDRSYERCERFIYETEI
jgi:hypothetical protein